MNTPKALAGAATAAVTLLAVAASFCIVAAAPARTFSGPPMTLALAGQAADTAHSSGELK